MPVMVCVQFIQACCAHDAIIHETSLKLPRFVSLLQTLLLLLLLLPHVGLLLQQAKLSRDSR